jgi:hypothetical protein
MNRAIRFALLAALLAVTLPLGFRAAPAGADDDAPAAAAPVPELKFFDGADWVPMNLHGCWVDGAGATPEGTATATFKAKLNGPKTYVVVAGTTSEVVLSNAKPRFRIASDRGAAARLQLAEFEIRDENRATTIERTSKGTLFTKSIDLEVTKIQDGLWEIRPTKSLEPGEYALATSDKDPVADFTIIEKGY